MRARVLAFYLPQFHPIEENDRWWGKGFTEWTNVGKAKKYFRGHYQPRVPADLGYYDLRVAETRKAQADMAREYGVEGFIYWHYWFGEGKCLLERPFKEVLSSGEPDFPFALAWANETWKGFDHGLKNRNTLIEQTYPGDRDYEEHFYAILPAFKDKRYVRVDGKPLFVVYKPHQLPDAAHFIALWQKLARENGLENGVYFVAHHQGRGEHGGKSEQESIDQMAEFGFDAVNFVRLNGYREQKGVIFKVWKKLGKIVRNAPYVYRYKKTSRFFSNETDRLPRAIPTIIPGWDHTPRSGKQGVVMNNSTPEFFEKHVVEVIDRVKNKQPEERLVFLKSWNEWAEGNYMEPDLRWGNKYLEALKRQLV